ncbi:MAG TPA: o-succinylbenzoate synthase, partial [Bacillota bacterium]|nr:o-succinylbenzoate synthase [Bacillota bacterium]
MELSQIKLRQMKMTMKHPFQTSFGTISDKEFLVIETKDSQGNTGYGESVAFTSPWYTEETLQTTIHMIEDFFIPLLRKNDVSHPKDITDIFSPIRKNNMAKASIEGSFWDLYAKS